MRPSGGASFDCVLKNSSSVINPTIIIKWDGQSGAPLYNQAYIPAYERYYWIDNWTYTDRCWVASMSVDALASFKDDIGNSEKYILRAAAEYNTNVIDTIYPVHADAQIVYGGLSGNVMDWATRFEQGRFVVGIVGENNAFSSGGVGYVVVDGVTVQSFINACFSNTTRQWENSTFAEQVGSALRKFGEELSKSVFNPSQFIASIVWLPFQPPVGNRNHVFLGAVDTNILAPALATEIANYNFLIDGGFIELPASDDMKWKKVEPFIQYELVCPPFGTYKLDAAQLIALEESGTSIFGIISVDCTSGEAILNVPTLGILGTARVGVDVKLAGQNRDMLGAVTSTIATAGSVMAMSGSVLGSAMGIGSLVSALAPVANSGGVGGGIAALQRKPYIRKIMYGVPEEDIVERGRPLCEIKTISTLSGYVLCADGDINANATENELKEIEAFLTGGFFYE